MRSLTGAADMSMATQDWWNRIPPAMTARRGDEERIVKTTSALEQMPHLAQRVCLLWGKREFESWVNQILMDARDGKRQGMPWQAAEEMLFLVQLSMAKRALVASETTGLPFHQIVRQIRAAAEAAAQAAERRAGPWGVARARRHERSQTLPAAERVRDTNGSPWWRRLFG